MSYAYVFVLSGYVLKVEDNPNILGFANRKLKRLMLPYILFIVINTTMEAFLHIYSLNEIKKKFYQDIFLNTFKKYVVGKFNTPMITWIVALLILVSTVIFTEAYK